MEIRYRTVTGSQREKPEVIDMESSKKYVYLRRNILRINRTDEQREEVPLWQYEEAKLTKKEYDEYKEELSMLDIRQQRADIDYIALMLGIDLEEE